MIIFVYLFMEFKYNMVQYIKIRIKSNLQIIWKAYKNVLIILVSCDISLQYKYIILGVSATLNKSISCK